MKTGNRLTGVTEWFNKILEGFGMSDGRSR